LHEACSLTGCDAFRRLVELEGQVRMPPGRGVLAHGTAQWSRPVAQLDAVDDSSGAVKVGASDTHP